MQLKTLEQLSKDWLFAGELPTPAEVDIQEQFIGFLTQDRADISTALVEALEGKKMKTPDNALAQYAEREKMGFNAGLTEAQNIIKELLESKN